MLSIISSYWDADTQLCRCECETTDGEQFEFTSDDSEQENARLRWISKALETPFIIEDDQE